MPITEPILAPALSLLMLLAPVMPAGPDADGDGVADAADHCPGTMPGYPVATDGCAADGDADGVADGGDRCPDTLPLKPGDEVGDDGCSVRDRKSERPFLYSLGIG